MKPHRYAIVVLYLLGCAGEATGPAATAQKPMPFKEISTEGDDPGENGPDDSTELSAISFGAGTVKFKHFTHASNSDNGFKVPCRSCHHTTAEGEDPGEGCVDCHNVPDLGAEIADLGPDDNLVLGGETQPFVPFNHFSHAASQGLKVACDKCHHTGDITACGDCHDKELGKVIDGKVAPKLKRAVHLTCKGCHTALKQTDPTTTAPTTCKTCHTGGSVDRLPGGLALNRAMHLSCVNCHVGVRRAKPETKAPVRDCMACHDRGVSVDPAKHIAPSPAAEKPAPVETEAPDPQVPEKEEVPAEAAVEGSQDPGPEHILIDYAKDKKTGTPFPHHLHQKLGDACGKCHHKGLDDPSCSKCHPDPKAAKDAFHKQCISCHREKGVPAGCSACHPKV